MKESSDKTNENVIYSDKVEIVPFTKTGKRVRRMG